MGFFIIASLILVSIIHHRFFDSISKLARDRKFAAFISDVRSHKGVDARIFWEFREFFDTGTFSFPPHTVTFLETQHLTPIVDNAAATQILQYDSPHIHSEDFVVKKPFQLANPLLSPTLSVECVDPNSTIYVDDNTLIYHKDKNTVRILFAASIDAMRTANGFFDYQPDELFFLQDKFWVDITDIRTN
ncbi:hypothetical protein C5B42_05285 [Candidatus Cerribacteria bacterium 'Amazon FNV 2010 28 9']|uniref:Uncharacterized protein n=1 Tax=Candidatus Cerribacteria bacterium 'Amazon FNV 2010 28 9' TaxID=2081795 RepID=A0A317JNJ6_9BACT|nr:MAG: hypothetical protein C5B42_05285 [Candidatus Cerribacteria bacterium 'Amazon FNV 2010 28 9']